MKKMQRDSTIMLNCLFIAHVTRLTMSGRVNTQHPVPDRATDIQTRLESQDSPCACPLFKSPTNFLAGNIHRMDDDEYKCLISSAWTPVKRQLDNNSLFAKNLLRKDSQTVISNLLNWQNR